MKKRMVMILLVSTVCILTACVGQEAAQAPGEAAQQTAETSPAAETEQVQAEEETAESDAVADTAKDAGQSVAADTETAETETAKTEDNESAAADAEAADAGDPDAEDTAAEETVGTDGDYTVCTDVDAATVNRFAASAKQAYLSEDWETVSGMILYPITMYPDVVCNNADEFLSYMQGKKIDDSDRAELEKETCNDMFARDLGVCMGSGQMWINSDIDTKELGITAISGIVEK